MKILSLLFSYRSQSFTERRRSSIQKDGRRGFENILHVRRSNHSACRLPEFHGVLPTVMFSALMRIGYPVKLLIADMKCIMAPTERTLISEKVM